MQANPYPDFTLEERTYLGETRQVFRQGAGPAVIVMHEVPGLYPGVAEFGRRVVAAGFTVYMPSVIGTPGRPFGALYSLQSLARACVAREFTVWATRERSPIIDWLRELARDAHQECGGPGVGAVGMCLTGGFALGMMVEECLLAPVLSQPSLPFALLPHQRRDLGVDDATLAAIKERAARGACVMGLRFTGDPLVPAARFQRLRDELGDAFIAVEIDSSSGNPHKIRRTAHSVLVYDFVDEPGHPTVAAREQVIRFFQERLLPAA
ncbi:MAG: dienelactone hydrolase family protein [Myxococcales bacterium]|nr:dienelactone hydrolase family protein [Myxococcales bacterium]